MRHWSKQLGMEFSVLVGGAFVALKLLLLIDWSWWAVTAPLWIAALTLAAVGVAHGGGRRKGDPGRGAGW